MREIKFRGKCVHSDAWAYGSFVDYGEEELPEIHGFDPYREGVDNWREITVERNTLGQFTGLTDKNGREIYEGDVFLDTEYYEPTYRKIVYRNGQWEAVASDGIWCPLLKDQEPLSDELRHIEIIGNIHDNPELLKQ